MYIKFKYTTILPRSEISLDKILIVGPLGQKQTLGNISKMIGIQYYNEIGIHIEMIVYANLNDT